MSNNIDYNFKNSFENFDDEILIALFRKGAHEYIENDLIDKLPDIKKNEMPEFSQTADKKIRKMIDKSIRKEKNKKRIKRLPRIAAVILIFLAVSTATVMSVDALRVPILNLFIDVNEEMADITLSDNQNNGMGGQSVSCEDRFGYIPFGFEQVVEKITGKNFHLEYRNMDDEYIYIDAYYGEAGSMGVDTEKAEYGKVMINDQQGFYSSKKGQTNLVFTKNEYVYSIIANIDMSELIKIAENIK